MYFPCLLLIQVVFQKTLNILRLVNACSPTQTLFAFHRPGFPYCLLYLSVSFVLVIFTIRNNNNDTNNTPHFLLLSLHARLTSPPQPWPLPPLSLCPPLLSTLPRKSLTTTFKIACHSSCANLSYFCSFIFLHGLGDTGAGWYVPFTFPICLTPWIFIYLLNMDPLAYKFIAFICI